MDKTTTAERGRATHAYLGLKPCGHADLMFVDDPFDKPWTAGQCAEAVTLGLTLQRVTLEEARTKGLVCDCPPPQRELALPAVEVVAGVPPDRAAMVGAAGQAAVLHIPAFLRRGGD